MSLVREQQTAEVHDVFRPIRHNVDFRKLHQEGL